MEEKQTDKLLRTRSSDLGVRISQLPPVDTFALVRGYLNTMPDLSACEGEYLEERSHLDLGSDSTSVGTSEGMSVDSGTVGSSNVQDSLDHGQIIRRVRSLCNQPSPNVSHMMTQQPLISSSDLARVSKDRTSCEHAGLLYFLNVLKGKVKPMTQVSA
jgi:hypothetical protein